MSTIYSGALMLCRGCQNRQPRPSSRMQQRQQCLRRSVSGGGARGLRPSCRRSKQRSQPKAMRKQASKCSRHIGTCGHSRRSTRSRRQRLLRSSFRANPTMSGAMLLLGRRQVCGISANERGKLSPRSRYLTRGQRKLSIFSLRTRMRRCQSRTHASCSCAAASHVSAL